MRVLLVEDDVMIGEAVQQGLKPLGMTVDWARDGGEGETALNCGEHELVLLDLSLPRKSGLQLLQGMRRRQDGRPVLILTARDTVENRIEGLDAGADDYVVKPFDLHELAARIRAVLRRHAGRVDPVIDLGELRVNPATREVTLKGQPVTLSAREYALLAALAERPGVPLSRAQLEERLYGWGEEIGSNTVEVYIHALRRKLGPDWIKNLRGVGYFVPKAAA
ncbi:two-component system response regulator QseB [Silvimonas terrae]|uniref:Two-component system response regulator QseB n=1 Tax=Silvimonas terrae TaxID=300266 RepID=A0A840RDB6_9NEIS|nr:response regulator [Silvimonas terrae]MBB5190302.1 two-component system response regulator QseB [Silvimonas terrae]